ncbi:tetratricopeptide repeat protein [Pseudomonas putida]|uniref:tetratricopeptide repeat protein n=1 Tax=Pseudomonas putida TaxID=303 RepID=UPI0018D8BEF9|nr:tetratricopeptide repeat protein [Pseudomonas putida]MBH3415866.1 tetratricopeptide repeat protein [Pseudomonas putida]MDG9814548.1 tetratricopeptide repeat protein [Pseudomonas putida]
MMKVKILGLVDKWRSRSNPDVLERHEANGFSKLDPSASPSPVTSDMSEPCVVDSGILESALALWKVRSFLKLTALDAEAIQKDKYRSIILLLQAVSHQWLGDYSKSRACIFLAHQWSADKSTIRNLLLSEAWFNLACCYQSAGFSKFAKAHVEQAMKIAPFDTNFDLSIESGECIPGHSQLNGCMTGNSENLDRCKTPDLQPNANISNTLLLSLIDKIDKQQALLANGTNELKEVIKSESYNNAQQIEAFMDLQNFFNHGRHLPKMHGWPISPDLALYLIDIVNTNPYDLVLEFGSGTSTILIAQALALKEQSHPLKSATKQIAFEHLDEYYVKTLQDLNRHQLADRVGLKLATLKATTFPGGDYLYYDCEESLIDLAGELSQDQPRILVLVDGPPARTGKHARYPALPMMLRHFPQAKMDIVLDDYGRTEEKGVVELWTTLLNGSNHHTYELKVIEMEKDACVISIRNA